MSFCKELILHSFRGRSLPFFGKLGSVGGFISKIGSKREGGRYRK